MAQSFVPDACSAVLIQQCIKAKKCLLNQLKLPKLEKKLGGSSPLVSSNANLRAKLDESYQAIIACLQAAYSEAGETFPALPTAPTAVDFSANATALEPVQANADLSAPLDFLTGIVEVTLDENDFPTLITVC